MWMNRAGLFSALLSVPCLCSASDSELAAKLWQKHLGASAPISTLNAQIEQESMWNKNAVSHVGARGYLQFMPATMRALNAKYPHLPLARPSDLAWSVQAASLLHKENLQIIKRRAPQVSECDLWGAALSAYNGGIKWTMLREKAGPSYWLHQRTFNPGIASWAQKENENYAPSILARSSKYFGKGIC